MGWSLGSVWTFTRQVPVIAVEASARSCTTLTSRVLVANGFVRESFEHDLSVDQSSRDEIRHRELSFKSGFRNSEHERRGSIRGHFD